GSGPEELMNNMEKLIAEVEQNNFSTKSAGWKKYDERFRHYYEECYDRWESEMKGREKRKFAGMVSRYIALRYGRSFFKNLFDGEKETESEKIPDLLKKFVKEDLRLKF